MGKNLDRQVCGSGLWVQVGPIAGSLYRHVICVCALKASKEAGQALVCKANPNFDVHHHHLLHCLEKTTVRTHTHTHTHTLADHLPWWPLTSCLCIRLRTTSLWTRRRTRTASGTSLW